MASASALASATGGAVLSVAGSTSFGSQMFSSNAGQVEAHAIVGQVAGYYGYNATRSRMLVTGSPPAEDSFSNSIKVNAIFLGHTRLLDATFGVPTTGDNDGATHTFAGKAALNYNPAGITGLIGMGMADSSVPAAGFVSLRLTVHLGDILLVDRIFADAASAAAYFNDGLINLGPISGLAGQTLEIAYQFVTTSSAPGLVCRCLLAAISPYDMWRGDRFSAAELEDPSISGDYGTPAGDGIPNMMKFALALDPHVPGQGGLTRTGTVQHGGLNFLTLAYTRPSDPGDFQYSVEESDDLTTWHGGTAYVQEERLTANGATCDVLTRAVQPIDSGAGRFLRLKVARP